MKKFFKIISLLMSVVLLASCGKKNEKTDEISPDSIAYLAEFKELDFGNSALRSGAMYDDFLYLLAAEWSEITERVTHSIAKISLLDGTKEAIALFPLAENESPNRLVINAQGNLLLLALRWAEEGGSSAILYEVSANDGAKISERDLGALLELAENSVLQALYIDDSDKLYFVTNDSGFYQIIAVDHTGQAIGKVQYNGYVDTVLCSVAGEVYISIWGDSGRVFKKADFAAGYFSNDLQLKGLENWGSLRFARGGETGALASDGISLYACDFDKKEARKLLNWLDCGVNANSLVDFGQRSDGSFWVLGPNELIILHQTTYGELPPRETIVLGTMSLDYSLQDALLDFNQRNQRYRVEVVEYYNAADAEAGELAFNLALTTGEIDIIAFDSTIPVNVALEDLNPYFDRYGIDRSEYFENILNVFTTDGKLYGVMTGFTLQALAAHESKLEGVDSWTVAEMVAWAEGYPEAKLMESMSRYMIVMLSTGKFIDWESGKVSFASEEFINILEFAATFDNAFAFQEDEIPGMHERYASGYYLLHGASISDLNAMQLTDALLDGEAKYIGYPSEDGGYFPIMPRNTLAISAQSPHKEGAFAFIAYMLSDAYQVAADDSHYFIPIKRSGVAALVASQTGEASQGERPLTTMEYDDLMVEVYASRNNDYVETFYDLISRADRVRAYDGVLNQIVLEEAEVFFAGQRTAAEVAEIIQNRVQVYVNENR